jgi:Zn-dependent protease
MDTKVLLDSLVMWLCFIPIVTFHEFAHAWTAWKLGDDTAHREGRVTLNPQSHIDPIGTLLIPGIAILLAASGSVAAGFIIGWGRSVPVNLLNLQNRSRDHSLIALAGPAMNIALALVCLIILRIFVALDMGPAAEMMERIAVLSVFLCWFNLLPIPPLDGSHVMKYVIGMSEETYMKIASFGIIILIVSIQLQPVRHFLSVMTGSTLGGLAFIVGLN